MYEVNTYHCDHCSKVYITKKVCVSHENMCYSNPATKSCMTCLYFSQYDTTFCTKKAIINSTGLQTGCKIHFINPDLID
jgi:hypothetical protein